MKCAECGAAMKTRRENYRYDECGLKYVTLMGVEVRRCPKCGNYEISIPQIEGLHRLLARVLIDKSTRFTGDEIRFLRKSLGWSGSDFAKHMGVADETVSRWENGAARIGPQADRLLRLMVAQGKLTMNYPTERLTRIDARKATITRLEVESRDEKWRLVSRTRSRVHFSTALAAPGGVAPPRRIERIRRRRRALPATTMARRQMHTTSGTGH